MHSQSDKQKLHKFVCGRRKNKNQIISVIVVRLTFFFSTILICACSSFNYTDAPSRLGGFYSQYVMIGYEGDIKPIEDVGIITTDGFIKVHMIDGVNVKDNRIFNSIGHNTLGRYQLHLNPGKHTLSLNFSMMTPSSHSWSTTPATKSIDIKKGQVIHLSLIFNKETWNAKESDGAAALPVISEDFKKLTLTK